MFKENSLIILLISMVAVQAAGVPTLWKTTLTAGLGIVATIIALSVRHRMAVLERELEHHTHATFVEN